MDAHRRIYCVHQYALVMVNLVMHFTWTHFAWSISKTEKILNPTNSLQAKPFSINIWMDTTFWATQTRHIHCVYIVCVCKHFVPSTFTVMPSLSHKSASIDSLSVPCYKCATNNEILSITFILAFARRDTNVLWMLCNH